MAEIEITPAMIEAGINELNPRVIVDLADSWASPVAVVEKVFRAMLRAGPYIRIDADLARAEFLARSAQSTAAIRAEGVMRFHIRQWLLTASGWLARLALALGGSAAADG